MTDVDGPPRGDADPFALAIDAVQPSQLYLNGRKLSLVTQWFDFADPNYDPLVVRRLERADGAGSRDDDERWILTDGHTRAFVAHLAGADELRVVRETDDLAMDVYCQCVQWCQKADVTEISDLAGRVVNADDFEAQWVERCQAAFEE